MGCYNFHQYQTTFELRFAAIELATALRNGLPLDDLVNLLGVAPHGLPARRLPDMLRRPRAVAAGFGEIGGRRAAHGRARPQRDLHRHDAELPADAPKGPTVCDNCSVCADLCPMHALDIGRSMSAASASGIRSCRAPLRLVEALQPLLRRTGLIGSITRAGADGALTIADVAGPARRRIRSQSYAPAFERCLRHCPAGGRR